nr:class I SAM-dependent methyltransferase [Nocardia wallacei]
MSGESGAVVNHHAGRAGFAGPAGLVVGVVMLVVGRRRARVVADLVGVTGEDHVVDIGCGPGGAVAVAARRGARVTGVDPAPMMLWLARIFVRGRGIRWAEGKAESLPVPDESATVAWAIATVHHWPEIESALTEVRRVLRPGGRFVTVERHSPADATGLASHGWTEEQAHMFANHCRTVHFTEVRVDRHRTGRYAFWAVRATRP